jgi:hypothetical protein
VVFGYLRRVMGKIDLCDECGVPLLISGSLNWEANGVISMAISPTNRVVLYEADIIDNLFCGIEQLLGVSLEHIVIESRRRDARRFVERSFPRQIEKMNEIKAAQGGQQVLQMRKEINLQMNEIASIYGFGKAKLSEGWERGEDNPWRTQIVVNPYSLYLYPAEILGSSEALDQQDMWVECTEIEEGTYEVTVEPGSHPIGLKERLKKKHYSFKPGDIIHNRCSVCGVPLAVTSHIWELERGIILDPATCRRMVIVGPGVVDTVLDDLQEELGESVAEAVIEAQRRYIKSAWSADTWNRDGYTFQQIIGMRGLGNMIRFEGDKTHLAVTIENSCLQLLMVGTMQALVELAYHAESSTCEWDIKEDGDLTISVILTP